MARSSLLNTQALINALHKRPCTKIFLVRFASSGGRYGFDRIIYDPCQNCYRAGLPLFLDAACLRQKIFRVPCASHVSRWRWHICIQTGVLLDSCIYIANSGETAECEIKQMKTALFQRTTADQLADDTAAAAHCPPAHRQIHAIGQACKHRICWFTALRIPHTVWVLYRIQQACQRQVQHAARRSSDDSAAQSL